MGEGRPPKGEQAMDRVTARVPSSSVDDVEALVEAGEFSNRSEAIREAVDLLLEEHCAAAAESRRKHSTPLNTDEEPPDDNGASDS